VLGEGHLLVDLVLDPLQLDPSPPHGWALADDRPSTTARPATNWSKQALLTPACQAKQKQSERGVGNTQEVSERERRGRVRRSVPKAADQTVTMPDRRTGRRAWWNVAAVVADPGGKRSGAVRDRRRPDSWSYTSQLFRNMYNVLTIILKIYIIWHYFIFSFLFIIINDISKWYIIIFKSIKYHYLLWIDS
jgi:hypothetical protein